MPPFSVLAVVDESCSDDALYPTMSDPADEFPIELTAEDGQVSHFAASRVMVQARGADGRLARLMPAPSNLKWDVLVTDSRVIVYCRRFDKGGGWLGIGAGGVVLAVAANAVSMARAAHRRKGKLLTGQVRYQWVASVGGSPKEGWRTSETLRIAVDTQQVGPGHRYIYLTLALAPEVDSLALAHDVSRRCARHHLSRKSLLSAEERSAFEGLAGGARRDPDPSEAGDRMWAWYHMPTSFSVSGAIPSHHLSRAGFDLGDLKRPDLESRQLDEGAHLAQADVEGADVPVYGHPQRRANRVFDPVYGGGDAWDDTSEIPPTGVVSGARPRRTFDPVYGGGESWDQADETQPYRRRGPGDRRRRTFDPVYGGGDTWDDVEDDRET